MCGKNFTCSARTKIALGSPPRVREKQLILQFINYTSRITPASAGKTFFYHVAMVDVQYRPHVCGKNFPSNFQATPVPGSLPRMREKRELEAEMTSYLGITPAYAGKTIKCYRLYSLNRDHPRVCGKNCVWFIFMLDKPGSPPHMREKPCQNNKDADCTGITPACAGKTCKRMYSHHLEWDHPRVCGKNATASNHFCPIPGSPPRLREKLRSHNFSRTLVLIFPT